MTYPFTSRPRPRVARPTRTRNVLDGPPPPPRRPHRPLRLRGTQGRRPDLQQPPQKTDRLKMADGGVHQQQEGSALRCDGGVRERGGRPEYGHDAAGNVEA